MNYANKLLWALAPLAALSCGAEPRRSPSPTLQAVPAASPQTIGAPLFGRAPAANDVPLTIAVNGPPAVALGDTIVLTITIHRAVLSAVPIALSVAAPAGVTLLAGQANEVIVDPSAGAIVRRLTYHLDQIPPTDLVVSAESRGTGYGVRAVDAYRFGRPVPMLPQPALPGALPRAASVR